MPAGRRIEVLPGAPGPARQDPRQRLVGAVDHERADARNDPDQMMELRLDGREIGEDVRVIELEIVQDCHSRAVMDELRALVEEGGVVLVGLDHEQVAAAQPRRHPEVGRHAADQETRGQSGVLEQPGEHRSGGGLAMGAGHREHPAPLQHLLGEPLGTRGVGQPGVQDGLHQGIPAGHHVAHDPEVRAQRELGGLVALHEFDAEGGQLVAHRRIDVGVAAGDAMPRLARQRGDPAHERTADAEDMDVHRDCREGARGVRRKPGILPQALGRPGGLR